MPNEKLGQIQYLAINMGTTGTPAWKQVQNEVETSINKTADKVEVTSKSSGTSKKFKKTLLDATLACKAYDDLEPTTNFLTYKDFNAIWLMTEGSTGGSAGTGLGNGVFEMKLLSVTTGDTVDAFSGFIDSLSKPLPNMDKIEYTFNIQPVTAITPTTVV